VWHNQPYPAQHHDLHLPEQTSSASPRRIITVAVSSATTRTSAIVAAFSEKSPRRDGRGEGGNRKAPRFDLRIERSADFIAEFVRLKVDVIVTHATANVAAANKSRSPAPSSAGCGCIDRIVGLA
jgi:hypothetical protein